MDILFWIHRSKANKQGLAPLKIRITCGPGDSSEITTGKNVDPSLWDVDKKRVKGKSVQADIVNKYIIQSEGKLLKIQSDLEANETPYNAEIVRNIFKGVHIQRYGLLQVLDIHNELWEEKKGQKGFSESTLKKYTGQLKSKLKYFIEAKYKRKDLFITELNYDFIESFWHFLTTIGKEVKGEFKEPMDDESACGIITRLKKIGKIGFRKQGIHINPWDDFVCSYEEENRQPLSSDQLLDVMTKDFGNLRLNRVRDRFIIGCLTGMADSDIQSATWDMVTTDINGNKWIDRGRTKTGELCLVPLWEPTLQFIEKYKNEAGLKEGKRLFPQISLAKMNAYLKEIGDLCRIPFDLTTHIARHTFADLYLNSGGTLENLARLLGHSDIRSTRKYARRNKTTIGKEADQVKMIIFGQLKLIDPEPVKKDESIIKMIEERKIS